VSHAACVGCGYCCKAAPCVAAVHRGRVSADGECLELVFDGERYRCNYILDPPAEGEEWWRRQLCVGAGCCSNLNSEREKYLCGKSS
jgi:hypothetical protein